MYVYTLAGTVGPIYRELLRTLADKDASINGLPSSLQIIVKSASNEVLFITDDFPLSKFVVERLSMPNAAEGRLESINGRKSPHYVGRHGQTLKQAVKSEDVRRTGLPEDAKGDEFDQE